MRRPTLVLTLSFAIALGASLPAGPLAPRAFAADADVVAAVSASEAEAKGDWDAWVDRLLDAVVRDPESPYALAALRKLHALHGSAARPERVEAALEPVLSRGVRDGEIDESLRDLLAARAHARGDDAKADAYGGDHGYLRTFAVAGPFGWDDDPLVHRAYGPEDAVLDPASQWTGARGRVGWVVIPPKRSGAVVEPGAHLPNAGAGVVYAVARVRSAATRPVSVKVQCDASFKVLVNGREAAVAERTTHHVPSVVWGDATLVPGWNRVLVKVVGDAAFAIKLVDPATGRPAGDLEEGDPLAGGALPDAGPAPEPRTYRTPTERALADGTADAARTAAAGFLAATDGRTWDAWRAMKRAAAAVGDEATARAANVHAAWGRLLSEFAPLPPVQRKLQAKAAFEAAVKAYPLHVSARVRLAEYENENDRPDRAVKDLRELVAAAPGANAHLAIARIARARGWYADAEAAARAALAAQPRNADAVRSLIEIERWLGDFPAVERLHRELLAIDRSDRGATGALVDHLRAQGRHADALRLLDEAAARWPSEWRWKQQRAQVLRALDRTAESLEAWKAVAAARPLDPVPAREQAEILEAAGDREGALAAYRRSLAIEAFQPAVWKAVARIEGRDEDFAAGWEPDVQATLDALPSTEALKAAHPKAVAITVLDHTVTRVHPDGSSQSIVHMIWKILDEKGVEKYADLPNAGELRLVRAILPDGSVTMPTGLQGRPYNMEGLVPGTIVEQRFVSNGRAAPKGYDGDVFYFQDFEFNDNPNPVLLSRLVVISPAGMRLDPVKRAYAGEPKVETTKDGSTATVWERRDMPRIDPERWMPPRDEVVPHVDYSIPEDFADAPWRLLGRSQDTRPTPYVEEALAKCVRADMDDTAKARAIHDWVNAEITGDGQSAAGPTAVLLEKSGSREVLVEAMLRAAGVPFRAGRALPWNGSGRKVAEEGADAFSGRFLWVEPRGGEPFALFVLAHHAPFGLVPEAYRGSAAFLLDDSGGRLTRLPEGGADTDDSTHWTVRIGADAKSVAVSGAVHYRSPNGYGFKRQLLDMSQDDRRKFAEQQLGAYFASPTLVSHALPRLDERGAPLEVRLEGSMANWLTAQGDRFVAALGLPKMSMASRYCDREERTFDLVLNAREDQVDTIDIDVGDAFEAALVPADHVAAHDFGTYSLTWRRDGRTLRVRREVHLHPARYRPDEYKAFVAWCKAIDDAEERKLELRKVR